MQASVGGPIKRDRLWFFYNFRRYGSADAQPGIFANKNAGDPTKWTYEPDFTLQGRTDVTPRHLRAATDLADHAAQQVQRVPRRSAGLHGAAWVEESDACRNTPPGDGWIQGGSQINGFFGAGPNSPETGDYSYNPQRVEQVKWQSPVTNRLLLEAGVGINASRWGYETRPGNPHRRPHSRPGAGGDSRRRAVRPEVPLVELAARTHRRPHLERVGQLRDRRAQHEVRLPGRVPPRHRQPVHHHQQHVNGCRTDSTTACRTRSRRRPATFDRVSADRVRRVLRPGAVDARTADAAGRAPLRSRLEPLSRADDRPGSSSSRPPSSSPHRGRHAASTTSRRALGAAYDLRGNGKTSLKMNVGKYLVAGDQRGTVRADQPGRAHHDDRRTGSGPTRTADYVPQCDLMNPALNGECGAWLDQTLRPPAAVHQLRPGHRWAAGACVPATGSSASRCSTRCCRACRSRSATIAAGGRTSPT